MTIDDARRLLREGHSDVPIWTRKAIAEARWTSDWWVVGRISDATWQVRPTRDPDCLVLIAVRPDQPAKRHQVERDDRRRRRPGAPAPAPRAPELEPA